VLYRIVEPFADPLPGNVRVRVVAPDEAQLWGSISARGWAHDHPEFEKFMREMGAIITARQQSPCFLAEIDGMPGAAGALILHEGVALFGGASRFPSCAREGCRRPCCASACDTPRSMAAIWR
jgi:hypothetical protein